MSFDRFGRLSVEALEDRTTPASLLALTNGNVLLRFDSATPGTVQTIPITGLGANQSVVGIDFRPRTGQLYASAVTTGSVANSIIFSYSVNALTGAATLVGPIGAPLAGAGDVPSGYDFNPTVDRLRFVNANDENARLNPNNGTLAGNDTDLTPAATSTIIAEAYDRNFDRQSILAPANNVIPTTLYAINRTLSQLGIQGGINGVPSPNGGVITGLAPLGFVLNATNDGGFDIAANGTAFAALTDDADDLTRLYAINLVTAVSVTPVATSLGLIGNGATEILGLAIVPSSTLVVGTGAGVLTSVQLRDAFTGAVTQSFNPFPNFSGGVSVASGDVNGDGVPDVVAGAGPGGGPQVVVFNGATGEQLYSFFAYDAGFRNGLAVATGDLNGDGFQDIITGAGAGGGPHVQAFSGRDLTPLASFFAYDAAFTGGVQVAAADFNLDGIDEFVTAAGIGGGPHIRIFNAAGAPFTAPALSNSFFAYDSAVRNGGFVATGDVNGDGIPDIVTGPATLDVAHVKAFSGVNASLISSFFAFDTSIRAGARVAVADLNADGRGEIRVSTGPGTDSTVRSFDGLTAAQLDSFLAFPGTTSGIYVGGTRS